MQNTAYELRISDWSSYLCSSDLGNFRRVGKSLPGLFRLLRRDFAVEYQHAIAQYIGVSRFQFPVHILGGGEVEEHIASSAVSVLRPDTKGFGEIIVGRESHEKNSCVGAVHFTLHDAPFGVGAVGFLDRNSVVSGKSVSVRVGLGGRSSI